MDSITLKAVAEVRNTRNNVTDDYWGNVVSEITLLPHIPTEAFAHIEDFSHLDIIYSFSRAKQEEQVYSGRPRGNPAYPDVGIFAQRKKDRPNHIGLCRVELLSHSGRTIKVRFLDAIDGTPVLDIKPVFREFEARSDIRQPYWVSDLMKDYWKDGGK